jgi:UDP-glucose 4-epimerase
MGKILVTGGAGYIGSVITEQVVARGQSAVVLDDFSGGYRAAVSPGAEIAEADILDREAVRRAFAAHGPEAVIHMAALIAVGESVEQPVRYYRQNIVGLLNVLDAMREHGTRRIVFSSTAAVYGMPEENPVSESCPVRPISPYGWTKAMCEQILSDAARADGGGPRLEWIALRYFNVAGATPRCGEAHRPETHLLPRVLDAALGRLPHVELYGDDYATPDGTCIRDYIHVVDLAEAHLLALDALLEGRPLPARAFNLGNNCGYSVREVIACVERVTGKKVPVVQRPRRAGDSPQLVASHAAARQALGWRPLRGLEEIVASAYAWRQRHPRGYE